jgi:hypothetical protein
VATISIADMAGVTILSADSNRLETVACTDERALDVDVDQLGGRDEDARCAKCA